MLEPLSPKFWTEKDAAHLLGRAGFGGTPSDIAALHELGLEKVLDTILDGSPAESDGEKLSWAGKDSLAEEAREQFRGRRELQSIKDPAERRKKQQQLQRSTRGRERERLQEMTRWWIGRMMSTPHPLQEKMTLFWHGHFATSSAKVRSAGVLYFQNAMFRKHSLGNFIDLTKAICRDPAMMQYLDANKNRKGKPNENFARELMELFVLGEGNYTEADVREAARACTGYLLNRRTYTAEFNRRLHDRGEKTILGKTGNFNAEEVVDILFEQKAAAHFLVTKLWKYFVSDTPPAKEIEALAATFRAHNFSIKPVLRELFGSKVFYDSGNRRLHIKSPVQLLVQMSKELELKTLPPPVIGYTMRELGQELFKPPNVAGWDGGKSWINTNTLLNRYNLAGVLVKGGTDPVFARRMAGGRGRHKTPPMARRGRGNRRQVRNRFGYKGPDFASLVPEEKRKNAAVLVEQLCWRFFQDPTLARKETEFARYARSKEGDGFSDRELAELVHLMMSTPYYQLT